VKKRREEREDKREKREKTERERERERRERERDDFVIQVLSKTARENARTFLIFVYLLSRRK
jgi:hypothetical protein